MKFEVLGLLGDPATAHTVTAAHSALEARVSRGGEGCVNEESLLLILSKCKNAMQVKDMPGKWNPCFREIGCRSVQDSDPVIWPWPHGALLRPGNKSLPVPWRDDLNYSTKSLHLPRRLQSWLTLRLAVCGIAQIGMSLLESTPRLNACKVLARTESAMQLHLLKLTCSH